MDSRTKMVAKMTSDEQYTYETKKVVKGREGKTIAQMKESGWELVSQESIGILRISLTFRRSKKQISKRALVVLGAIGIVVVGSIVVGSILESNDNETAGAVDPVDSSLAKSAAPEVEQPSPTGSIHSPSVNATEPISSVHTVANTARLAEIMNSTDTCSPLIADFADDFKDQTIKFDGNIGAMNNHADFETRYDILIGYGDFDPDKQAGPAFQFRDVNTVSDLKYSNPNIAESIGVGDNLVFTAKIEKFESKSCLLILDPLQTAFK